MQHRHSKWFALRMAFSVTVPILAGFVFLGIAYGIYMNTLGFHPIYPIVMSFAIFAGSMEFVAANLLLLSFNPGNALLLTLMINARHLFYGLSMLDTYRGIGRKNLYMIYGLCDESFSINCSVDVPKDVDKGWFMFFVTLLNHVYWVAGAAIGGLMGSVIRFDTHGLEFVMTALFVVIFVEQWSKVKQHYSAISGIVIAVACLLIFGGEQFMIPAMIATLGALTLLRKTIEKAEAIAP